MIEYVEIYSFDESKPAGTRRLALEGLVDDFSSVIWKVDYYGSGQFEVYAPATPANLALLKGGRYVLRPDAGDAEVGIVERVEVTWSPDDGRMVAASGRMAKSLLERRIIYDPIYDSGEGGDGYVWHFSGWTFAGKVDQAAKLLVRYNASLPRNNYPTYLKGNRQIPVLWYKMPEDGESTHDAVISVSTDEGEQGAEKQVTYKNLLEYTDGLLKEYGLGARLWLDREMMLLRYEVYSGRTLASGNHPDGEPVLFSQEMDNLVDTTYVYDESAKRTVAIVAGEGEGLERKGAFAYEYVGGLERREVFVDASGITSEVDEGEAPVGLADYRRQLEAQGQQTVAQSPAEETLSGKMDVTNSHLAYRRDFRLGDVVTLEDSGLGLRADVRIVSVTEVQDEDGYNVDIEYGNE